jgi:hypothetical protein
MRILGRRGETGSGASTSERLLLVGILILGASVRVSGLDLGWFMLDQARDATEAVRIAEGKSLPLVGPIARGLYALGPLYYYLIAIPFWFSKDPSVAVFFLNLLNLASVYVTYRLGREFFSPTAGLVAAALYAVFPMAVMSSKAVWNPGFIPFFGVAFFYFLFHFLVGQRPWGLVGALVALSCFFQIHMTGFVLILLLVLALILFRPRIPLVHLAIGLLLSGALYASYLYFEVGRRFEGLRQALAFVKVNRAVGSGVSFWTVVWRALTAPFTLPQEVLAALVNEQAPTIFPWIQRLELFVFITGLLYVVGLLVRRGWAVELDRRRYGLLLLWILVPLLVLSQKKIGLVWYYFDVLYPSQFLTIGILVSSLVSGPGSGNARRGPTRWVAATVSLAVIWIVLLQTLSLVRLERAIVAAGTLRFPTSYNLRFPDPWWSLKEKGFVETMPTRYMKALTGELIAELGADERTFGQNVHGASFEDLREDKGYFFDFLSETPVRAVRVDGQLHAVILRDDLYGEPLVQGKAARIGPFRIVRYRPLIRYASWKYGGGADVGWQREGFDDSGWASLWIPARNPPNLSVYDYTPFHAWRGSPVHLRGWMDSPPPGRQLQVVVSLRDDFASPHEVEALFVNGRKVEAARTMTYHAVLARSYEAVFDVTGALKPGPNLIAIAVSGVSPAFDLDVYELLTQAHDRSR